MINDIITQCYNDCFGYYNTDNIFIMIMIMIIIMTMNIVVVIITVMIIIMGILLMVSGL